MWKWNVVLLRVCVVKGVLSPPSSSDIIKQKNKMESLSLLHCNLDRSIKTESYSLMSKYETGGVSQSWIITLFIIFSSSVVALAPHRPPLVLSSCCDLSGL